MKNRCRMMMCAVVMMVCLWAAAGCSAEVKACSGAVNDPRTEQGEVLGTDPRLESLVQILFNNQDEVPCLDFLIGYYTNRD